MAKILIIEDDEKFLESLIRVLKFDGHVVEFATDGISGQERLRAFQYDLLILDWQLPGISGPEICQGFRNCGGITPIIMLTGKSMGTDKSTGLDSGADDYITKPFEPVELSARIRAVLRRPPAILGVTLSWGDLKVDTRTRRVTRQNEEIGLQPMEYALLEFFLRHPDQVFSTEGLLERCWDSEKDVGINSTYTCIRRIRKKLDVGEASIIETVHSLGYRLGKPPNSDVQV